MAPTPRGCASRLPGLATPFLLVALSWMSQVSLCGVAAGDPLYFPPTAAGWPGEVRDERDVTPYLAFHKSRAMQRQRALQTVQTSNQAAYDVHYYDLDLQADPATQVLVGAVKVLASVVSGPLSTMDLDFYDNMIVDSVTAGGSAATFTHAGNLLTVNLDRTYPGSESMAVVVHYHGTPAGGPFGSTFGFDSHAGKPLIWTLSEPFGSRSWWPCKDYPEDKADSVDIRMTVPSGMVTASNGTRTFDNDDGVKAVTRWRVRYPIATYLVAVSSYAYTTWSDWYRPSPSDSMEIQFYVFPEDAEGSVAVNAKVKDMIAAYAARFGPYPFLAEKYGEAEFPWGGGMENQTITSLGGFWEYVVAHELGHQWWGDMTTCRNFHHVWLNEGFATFCQAIWTEAGSGLPGYHSDMAGRRYYGPGTVYAPDENDVYRVFDGNLSYNKASWVLHMLRHVMGDSTFFAGMRAYGLRYRYGTAVTEDFRDVCASAWGHSLDRFFQQWVYGEYYPQYRSRSTATPSGGGYDVTVVLEQIQGWQMFWMPVDVTITTADSTRTFVAMDSLPVQSFTWHTASAPQSVEIDKDEWILRTIAPPVTAVENAPPAQALRFLPVRPNPVQRSAAFEFSLPAAGPVRLTLVGVGGARVRTFSAGPMPAGTHQLNWDGRDDRGRRLASGVYTAVLEAFGQIRTRKLLFIH